MDFSIIFCAHICVFLLIPCFSSSCSRFLPCNKSIEISPPFFYYSEINSSCSSLIKIKCVHSIPTIYPFHNFDGDEHDEDDYIPGYFLESISYNNNTLVIKDSDISSYLMDSNCSSFDYLLNGRFNYSEYLSLKEIITSLKCDHINRKHFPWAHFHCEKLPPSCFQPKNTSFEWVLSFKNQSRDLFLESAKFSSAECFALGRKRRGIGASKRKKIIIGAVSGALVSLFVISCFCTLLYFKRKKWKWLSSSSKLLINKKRDLSDPYMTDFEFAGSQNTQIFTYEELEEATDSFKNELGDGGFGTVYKGKLRDGRIVAVKRLYKNSYKRVEQFMNEVEILSNLRHPNLVTLYGCTARTSHELLLVYEYIPNGTVADHLHGPRVGDHSLTWPLRLNIAIETAQALTFLHSIEPQIIHRDVKTNNILLDEGFHVKVGDFGLSRLFPLDVTHVSTVPQGTPGYVDPVYHQCYQLTEKSDVYSFGVVLIELISSKPAVDMSRSSNEINLANLALNKIQRSELSELVDPKFEYEKDWEMRRMVSLVAELAFRCLQGEREMRPTIKEALEVLLVVQKEGFGEKNKGDKDNNGEKVKEESETCLLRDGTVYSPDTVVERWTSRTTTPNTSV